MVRAIDTLREPAQFEAWLFRIARHMCLDQIRRNKVRQIFTPFLPQHADIAEASGAVNSEELDALRYALSQLSAKDRALSALVQEGRSQMEISSLLSINIAATKARIHRVRQRLRAHYETRG